MKRYRYLTLAIIILVSFGLVATAGAKGTFKTLVNTKYGKIQGYETDIGALAWKNVPYAKPPVGDLRWKAPEKPDKWHGERDGSVPCEPCTQLYTLPNWIRQDFAVGSEDCLYLSIYRPAHKKKKLPVYVWIHGGSNNFGQASDYDGSILANKGDLVVVVIQYRLGPLGWFTHPALRHGDSLDDSGNFGTLDTIRALEWIKKNIKAFGGDPKKVTVTGESAGAHNVMNLVISPLAKDLFHRAMSQSGGMTTDTIAEGEATANSNIAMLLTRYGNTWAEWESWSLDEQEAYLRAADAKDLYEVLYGAIGTYDAYQDGVVLPGSVVSTIRSGKYNKVPIILGANEYESKAFLPLYGPAIKYFGLWGGGPWATVPSSDYTWMNLFFGVMHKEDEFGDPLNLTLDDVLPSQEDKLLYQITGYYGSRNWRAKFVDERARALRDQQKKIYAYLFKWGGNSDIGSGPSPFDFIYGAGHAMEIPFFFGSDTSMWGFSFSPGNDFEGRMELSDAMIQYVANFAREGKPNGKGLPKWKEWSNKVGKPKVIMLDADFDDPLISMSDEEVTITGVAVELAIAASALPPDVQDLPWFFLWSSAE